MLRFLRWIFGIKHSSSTDFTPQQTDNSPSIVESILVKPAINVIQEQQIDFSRENNLLREGIWEEPPSIINGDSTVFYKRGDVRNTYEPGKSYSYEDFDGSIKTYGGSGDISAGVDTDDSHTDEVDNNPDIIRYKELDKEWQLKNKLGYYTDAINKEYLNDEEKKKALDKLDQEFKQE